LAISPIRIDVSVILVHHFVATDGGTALVGGIIGEASCLACQDVVQHDIGIARAEVV